MIDSAARHAGATQTAGDVAFWAAHPSNDEFSRATRYRIGRVRQQLARRDYAGVLLYNPVNIRYATGTRNMQVWHLHNHLRHALILNGGPTILFEYPRTEHILREPGVLVDEVRPPRIFSYIWATSHVAEIAAAWAREIAAIVAEHGGGNHRLAVDRVEPAGLFALQREGLIVEDGQALMEAARCIKSAEEIRIIRWAIAGTELAIENMRDALRPGITEQALWSQFHQKGMELGGEWVDTRLLASGPRTNPWFQECGERVIEPGDLVAFDTDFVGPGGYYADISRTWLCGDGPPSRAQHRLYADAHAALERQLALLRPGMTFREYSERVGPVTDRYADRRYTLLAHGLGMAEEYPSIPFQQDLDTAPTDGMFEAGMTVCVEYYAGEVAGREGVKIEEQVLVTESGIERLSTYRYEQDML